MVGCPRPNRWLVEPDSTARFTQRALVKMKETAKALLSKNKNELSAARALYVSLDRADNVIEGAPGNPFERCFEHPFKRLDSTTRRALPARLSRGHRGARSVARAEYIGWLTHRPPQFALFENRDAVLIRHFSMREWPSQKRQHYSGNFFIEKLTWLVRSGLVRKLFSESERIAVT